MLKTTSLRRINDTTLGRFFGSYLQAAQSINNTFTLTQDQFTARKIKPTDSETVKYFIQKMLIKKGGVGIDERYYDSDLTDVFHTFSAGKNGFWALAKKGEIYGTLGLKSRGEEGVLSKFYLEQEAMGHAEQLLKMAQSAAKRHGMKQLRMAIDASDAATKEIITAADFVFLTSDGEGLDFYVQIVK